MHEKTIEKANSMANCRPKSVIFRKTHVISTQMSDISQVILSAFCLFPCTFRVHSYLFNIFIFEDPLPDLPEGFPFRDRST